MKKKILAVCTSLLMAVAFFSVTVTSAVAAEMADPGIFIEKSADAARVYPGEVPGGDYLRFRALFLTEDGTPADTFMGVDIENCNINITLDNATLETKKENVEIAYVGSAVEPKDITFAALDAAAGSPDADASFEFAISVDAVRATGSGILTLTLDNGTATVTDASSISFAVTAPQANGYVVRTGTASTTSIELGEEISAATNNDGAGRVSPETDVSVTVFAVYSPVGQQIGIFTDNVPEGADTVTVTGMSSYGVMMTAIPSVSLTDGIATQTLAITDLKIPENLTQYALANPTDDGSDHIGVMSDMFTDGIEVSWSATSSVTREIGSLEDDTVSGGTDGVIVGAGDIIGTFSSDTTEHGVGSLDEIRMAALPVNAVQAGTPVIVGVSTALNGATDDVSPLDAYLLLDAPETQPAAFTAVCDSAGYMYGALMGWDAYDNPSPVAYSTTASFPMSVGDDIATTLVQQAFVPFAIENTTEGEAIDVYVDGVATGTDSSRIKCYGEGNGIEFTGDAYVTQTFLTTDFTVPTAGSVAATLGVQGELTQTYAITSALYIDPVAGTQGELEITETDLPLSATTPNLAEAEFNINTAVTADTIALYILQGENNAMMISSAAITTEIVASNTVGSVSLLYPGLTANVVVGSLGNNNKIRFDNMYKAYDALGNEVVDYDAADLQAIPTDSAGAELTAPWALGEVNGQQMNYQLTLSAIPADGIGYVQLRKALDATVTGDPIKTNIRIISGYEFSPVLSAAPGFDIPVLVNLTDQAGERVAPVDQSTYTVEITTDNASTTVTTSPATITSDEDNDDLFAAEVFVIDPATSIGEGDTIVVSGSADGFLGLLTYSIDLGVDTVRPEIDPEAFSSRDCEIIIPVTDNVAVDVDGTIASVTVSDFEGIDVTSECVITGSADGTNAEIVINVALVTVAEGADPSGSYSVQITAKDVQGNVASVETDILATVYTCDGLPKTCLSVAPTFLVGGESGPVVITGENTSFDDTTVVTGCSDVTVGDVTITSATELTVTLTAGDVDADTTCNLTATTGTEEITCTGEFEIQPAEVCVITATPATLRSGWLVPRVALVVITGGAECDNFTLADTVGFSERLIPVLPIPLFNRILVPTIIWPGTEDITVDVTVGDLETTIEVIAGFLP